MSRRSIACFALALFGSCSTTPSNVEAPSEFAIRFLPGPNGVLVGAGPREFTTFRVGGERKPCLYPLIAPNGARVTRGFPLEALAHEEEDHPHHVSMWFAHGDVNGHDFWHGGESNARIVPSGALAASAATSSLRGRFDWTTDAGLVCTEDRVMTFHAGERERCIDLEITLTALDEPLRFGDTKEGTMALRLAPTLRVEGEVAQGTSLNSEGDVDGAGWGKRARWVAYMGPAPTGDGELLGVTVSVFDHPENPRHPTWWHARTYGLVAANPFGVHDFEGEPEHTGDLVVPPHESITFRYRVRLASGRSTADELENAWAAYAER